MKVLPCFFLLLSVSSLVGAQNVPEPVDAKTNRPMNLSVRQHLALVTDAKVILIDPKAQATEVDSSLPYGSGFESRRQGNTSAGGAGSGTGGSSGSGASAGSGGSGGGGSAGGGGGSGNGGGGRGGSGRGR
ncbi:MAG TPA: hypothetical protein VIM63_16580 [Rhodoferax sp.]